MDSSVFFLQAAAGDYSLLENIPVGIGIYQISRTDIRLIYNNTEYYHVHHGSKEYWDAYGQDNALLRIIPEDQPQVADLWQAGDWDNERVYDFRYRCRAEDGSDCWIRLLARFVQQIDDVCIYYGVHLDFDKEVSDETLAQRYNEKIEQREKKLEQNYHAAQELIDRMSGATIASTRSDLTHDVVEMIGGDTPLVSLQGKLGYDEMLDLISRVMPRKEDVLKLDQLVNRKALLKAYEEGEHSLSIDYFFRPPKQNVRLARSITNLMRRPDSEDVMAFTTVTDVTQTVLVNTIISQVLIHEYDFIAMIDAVANTFSFIKNRGDSPFFTDGEEQPSYDQWLDYCAANWTVPDQKESFVEAMSLMHIVVALKRNGQYSVCASVQDKGEIRNKRLDFFYIDEECQLIAVMGSDYTEMQREQVAHEQLLRTALRAANEASVAKSSFLSRMSHEIRTPLNAIIGMDVLAKQYIDDKTKLLDCIDKIGISARYLLSLINDILDMSRIESGKLVLKSAPFQFKDFIAGISTIIQNQALAKQLQYNCNVDPEILETTFIGDEMKLQQSLINILGNAVKFTQSGSVSLAIETVVKGESKTTIRFIMRDTGCGIDKAKQKQIFEPFEQVDNSNTSAHGGTGLGLAITKNLIEMMGGTISLTSVVGLGSTFTITVPLERSKEAVLTENTSSAAIIAKSSIDPSQIDFAGMRFLLAEDNEINAEIAKALLERKHATIDVARNGKEAVEIFTSSAPGTYQVILMDVRMPVMDGLEASNIIRSSSHPDAKGIPIVAMTANAFDDDVERSRVAGMNAHLSKPVEPESMFMIVAHAIGFA